jgi:hypothetical protein
MSFAVAPAFATASPAWTGPWAALAGSSPFLWGWTGIVTILALALLAQLLFTVRRSRFAPGSLVQALNTAIQGGNYQGAWEASVHRSDTVLGRMLQPALERLGQGRDEVEMRLAEEGRRELRRFSVQLWCLLGLAVAAGGLAAVGAVGELRSTGAAAWSADVARAPALHAGQAAVFAALALAVLVPAAVVWPWLRDRAELLLGEANEQGLQLVAGLPYEDIEGLRVGRDFDAGTILGDVGAGQTGRLKVSMELTTRCPSCNGAINFTRDSCPHCGQLLSWS